MMLQSIVRRIKGALKIRLLYMSPSSLLYLYAIHGSNENGLTNRTDHLALHRIKTQFIALNAAVGQPV